MWTHTAKGAHPYRKSCISRGTKVASPPLDSHCDGPVTYPGDTKIIVKSSKRRSGPFIYIYIHIRVNLNLSHYRSGVAPKFPGS